MNSVRELNNPIILKLLKEHDELTLDQVSQRKALQRRILFLMTSIKLYELENERFCMSICNKHLRHTASS